MLRCLLFGISKYELFELNEEFVVLFRCGEKRGREASQLPPHFAPLAISAPTAVNPHSSLSLV